MMLLFSHNDIQWSTNLAVVQKAMQFNTIFFLWKNALCSEPYLLESDVIMKNNHGSRDKKATKQWQKEIQNASFNAS